jgi:hypothetical protein
VARWVLFARHRNGREVVGDVIRADRFVQIRKRARREFLLQLLGFRDDICKGRVAFTARCLKT